MRELRASREQREVRPSPPQVNSNLRNQKRQKQMINWYRFAIGLEPLPQDGLQPHQVGLRMARLVTIWPTLQPRGMPRVGCHLGSILLDSPGARLGMDMLQLQNEIDC
jgi:hypothetical protein